MGKIECRLPLLDVRVLGVDEETVIAALEDEVSRIRANLDAGPTTGEDPQTFAFYSEGQLYGLEYALRAIRGELKPD